MNNSLQVEAMLVGGLTLIFALPMTAIAQTYSPYTPAQIQEFNNQPIAPIETPAGPVYLERPPVTQKP
ncbi:MAG: hypothetical protein B7Y05_08100, partial [Polynucleobacter sp. 24-46-87]